jgi:hypothetical protein
MQVRLSNGVVIEGTIEQIQTAARAFGLTVPFHGDGIHYNSTTHGLIKISDMDTRHVRNALIKLYVEWVAELRNLNDVNLAIALTGAPTDRTLIALMNEFIKRQRVHMR